MIEPLLEVIDLILERLRANLLRLRGAKLGQKSRIARRVRALNPQNLSSGERLRVEDDVYFKIVNRDAKIDIGSYVFLGKSVHFDVQERVSIGNNCLIAPNVFITDQNHNINRDSLIRAQGCSVSPVIIEEDVWVGTKATILPGVTLAKGSVVAAGAVVKNNVAAMTIVAGVPARPIGKRTGVGK